MVHKTVSCSFADCRDPSYARWLRVAHFLNIDEPVNTTFLACRDHDRRLNEPADLTIPATVLRIGLYQDEQCFHNVYEEPILPETAYGETEEV